MTASTLPFVGASAVVTGGTNGIGAATALRLRSLGADVVIVGRSQAKADDLVARAAVQPGPGSLDAVVADMSLMRSIEPLAAQLADRMETIDLLVNGVGIFLTRPEHTSEGLEADFATSYLSRFALLESSSRHGLLTGSTRLLNLAASSRRMPRFAKVEYDDVDAVAARTGFATHTSAQTANDLLVAQAGKRYGISALGYGPGNVDTGILREIPLSLRIAFAPVLLVKRTPEQAAEQIVGLLGDDGWRVDAPAYAGRKGRFPADPFVLDRTRQADVLEVSTRLLERALAA